MKYVKLSAIVGLILLVCVAELLFYKRVRTTESDSSAPVAKKEVFAEQTSNIGEASNILGDMEVAGVPHTEPPATASKTNGAPIAEASALHQYVEAEKSNALAMNATLDSGSPEVLADESSENNSRAEESMQDVEFHIAEARANLETMNVPVGERAAMTSIKGDEIIVTFPPKPGERAGDYIVRMDRATGKVIDTKIWR